MSARTFRTLATLAAASLLATAAPASAQYARRAPPAPVTEVPRQHASAVEAYGGLYPGPLNGYVSRVGDRMAQAAGRGGQCGFHVLNTDVVNAFTSPPGCHVYVTRGLLALMNSEDELAAVLGHEVGHVAANHAGRRQQRSTLGALGSVLLGAITGSGQVAQLASAAAKANVLSYSRSQEFQADKLSVNYLAASGYAPQGLVGLLEALQREDQFDNRMRGREAEQVAVWTRSHPLTSDRIARAAEAARVSGPPGVNASYGARDPYLAAIDGLTFGDDPSQGFIEGRSFTHPGLGVGFTAPQGFTLTNSSTAVGIEGPGGSRGLFSAGRLPARGGLDAYAYEVLRGIVGQSHAEVGQPQYVRINGLDAVVLPARARAQSGVVDLTVAAYAAGSDRAYHFVTLSPAGRGEMWEPLIGSFRRLDPREAAEIRPKRIEVVTVRPGDTVQSLAQRMAFDDLRLERFMMLNALEPGEPLRPGQRVKLVTTARR